MKRLVLLSTIMFTCFLILSTTQAQVTIDSISSDNQIGAAGYPLPNPLHVEVEKDGVRIPNHPVEFTVLSGSGYLIITNDKTDNTGRIKSTFILGPEAGENTVEVKVTVDGKNYGKIMRATGIRPITDIFDRTSGSTPNIWRKFIGEDVPGDVPNLIDYSYAGYKNGEEPIPDVTGTIYDVTSYGAIPNDNLSDTQAIKDTLSAAEDGGIVFFPPGQYDVLLPGEPLEKIDVGRRGGSGNIVLRGSGAQGAIRNGTTIKMHENLEGHLHCLFEGIWQHNGSDHATPIVGEFPRGTKSFDVADSSRLLDKQFLIIITTSGLFDDDWAEHSSRSINEMSNRFTEIRSRGIHIKEFHEIDRIEGNRVYIKAPTTTPLNSNYSVYWKNLQTNIGFEDIHFDGNLQEPYKHNVQPGRGWIALRHVAHSWVQRCRFSNSTIGVWISGYGCSVLSVIQDGRRGHYTAAAASATYCLIGLLEDHTDFGAIHGINISGKSSGNVAWGIGGPVIDGPDTHGNQPRNTLLDNYHSQTHESSSGQYRRLPHHLDGWTRWNNVSEESRLLDMWTTNPEYYFITQSNLIGYVGASGLSNTYSEFSGSNVHPNSLYEAQLERRLGYLPLWVDTSKHNYNEFFGLIFGGELPPPRKLAEDVNDDRTVNIQDLVLVAGRLGQSGANSADVNGDGVVNIQDLVLVAGALGSSATAPSLYAKDFSMLTAADVKKWLSEAQQLDLTDAKSLQGILFLQQLLAALTNPKETALLPNYPNPFNPETWIPYYLAKASDVQITIYDMRGTVVRRLDLGHQREGYYTHRSRTAHWDGRNAIGERVASGLYFYQLQADNMSLLRKMVILK